jgi:SAM-dependent methyltransferase
VALLAAALARVRDGTPLRQRLKERGRALHEARRQFEEALARADGPALAAALAVADPPSATRVALAGRAEALPLDDASVDGAVSSDAWHWFDGARAADELARVVRPGGGVVVSTTYPTWADGDGAPDWWLDLRAVHAALPKGDHPAFARGWRRPDSFDGHAAFDEVQTRSVPFVHHTDREGIVAHWASMSFVAALPDEQREQLLGELDAMLARRGIEDVDVPYRAELWITRRRRDRAPPAGRAAAAS